MLVCVFDVLHGSLALSDARLVDFHDSPAFFCLAGIESDLTGRKETDLTGRKDGARAQKKGNRNTCLIPSLVSVGCSLNGKFLSWS